MVVGVIVGHRHPNDPIDKKRDNSNGDEGESGSVLVVARQNCGTRGYESQAGQTDAEVTKAVIRMPGVAEGVGC